MFSSQSVAIALAVLLAALQAVDLWTTWRVLRLGGFEANVVMRWLMDRMGVMPALVVAKCAASAIGFAMALLGPRYWSAAALIFLCVFYAFIAANNVKHLNILRAKHAA